MSKHEAPPFRMVIEGGKLVPATSYDAERLDTYRRGTRVSVRFIEEKDRVLVRKWWAVLGLVIKQCKTPWKTKDEASEAIKLALGIVNLTKTIGGDFLAYPKSLTELDEPELADAVEQMMELLHRVTGVDPETLRKEAAHVGEDEHEPSSAPSTDDVGSGAAPQAPHPGDAADLGAGDLEEREEPSSSPAPILTDADRAFLVRVFKTMREAVGPDVDVLKRQALVFKDDIAGKSDLVKAKAKTIREKLEKCCGEEPEMGTIQAAKYLAGVIGVDERELA